MTGNEAQRKLGIQIACEVENDSAHSDAQGAQCELKSLSCLSSDR